MPHGAPATPGGVNDDVPARCLGAFAACDCVCGALLGSMDARERLTEMAAEGGLEIAQERERSGPRRIASSSRFRSLTYAKWREVPGPSSNRLCTPSPQHASVALPAYRHAELAVTKEPDTRITG